MIFDQKLATKNPMAEALKKQFEYLKNNGFTEKQANTLVFFQKDYVENYLATKVDVELIRRDIEMIKKDIVETKKDF